MNELKIQKKFKQWEIDVSIKSNFIEMSIYNKNSYKNYKSSLKFQYLNNFEIFSKCTMNEIFDLILTLISHEKFEIIEEEKIIKFILIYENNITIPIILNKIENVSKELIDILLNKIDNLQKNNKNLEEKIEILIKTNTKLEKRIEFLENQNNQNKKEFKNQNINKSQLYETKIKELENKINKLEKKSNDKVQFTTSNLKLINEINSHQEWIRTLTIFPSGNLISGSNDLSIKIYDKNYQVIQTIENAHESEIIDISVLDENNFVSTSNDSCLKIWIKKNENEQFKFILYQLIENAHLEQINKVIYYQYGKIISCGCDNKIRIWEEYNGNYELVITLISIDIVYSILLLKDKNILISSGINGIYFWNFNNFEKIIYIKEIWCARNALKRIDDDRIIIGSGEDGKIKIISISEKRIIHIININFITWGICVINNKGLFLVSGINNDIVIFRSDNYQSIQRINNAHDDDITGIIELKDGSIASFGCDSVIKIWSF